MKIALGQINPTIGDFTGNSKKIIESARQALDLGAQMVLFPELAVCGYPPRDLLEKPAFVERSQQVVNEIARAVPQITIICGFVSPAKVETGKSVMNSAAVLREGAVQFVQSKMLLPTYDVFDESAISIPPNRKSCFHFAAGSLRSPSVKTPGMTSISGIGRLYRVDPVDELLRAGGNMVINISASPFHLGKRELRRQIWRRSPVTTRSLCCS